MTPDYIVIGAGSAGCVVAARLSEDPAARVLLLEAGGPDSRREISIPAAFPTLFKTEIDWAYETEPQPELDGRRMFWPRGKVLGGTSSMNAMIYVRGHPSTYDAWAAAGCAGWGWDDLLPIFRRSERSWPVERLRDPNRLSEAFVEAAAEVGLPVNDDFNGPRQEGVGLYDVTQRQGRRMSTAAAFLRPALRRPNLTVETGALATRLLFEGDRATGVEYRQDGATRRAGAAAEIVLAGGAINSPQLLLLSGVGPAEALERMGLDVVADLPGVGENLQDHLIGLNAVECREPITLSGAETLGQLARYLLLRRGLLTSNVGEAGGFVRLDPGASAPDLQFHFAPGFFVEHGFDSPPGHGASIAPTLVRPRSVGRLRLVSSDPEVAPAIDPRYLSRREDLETLVEGTRLARRILDAPAFAPFRGAEVFPGAERTSNAELEAHLRRHAQTIYHPVGTCRMGTDERAVVDPELRVRGLGGLRVADASVMPTIPNGNTNAATIAIGERAADLLARG